MSRRRRSRFPFAALLLLAALAAAALLAWRHWPVARAPSVQTVELAVPARAAVEVCALAPLAIVAQAAGREALGARALGAAPEVPAAGVCRFEFAGASVDALVFTRASRLAGGAPAAGRAWFDSALTGLEYAFKQAPIVVDGLGDAAAAAGFAGEAADEEPPQLVVLQGETALQLIVRGLPRTEAEAVARVLLAGL